ncbi:hypothetical protein SODALDRAFT_378023 [Sodiomyces alkalinus F11]|uniref:Uncharacterized protein n=1 Tax=Sodiomyces alkalinus (strain CBS 110278 / VKM F-3762 / F11) TaxID=1314773 RepID=A0A3N2PWU9_SODAK|nr:hypothetical protein SODALDRAFT_378023 [Sodiomyces alkalinus F11]ROT38876.1 hypothetical protein SODALDRAFT_378023 [Sodiomyces alkalinus F11]
MARGQKYRKTEHQERSRKLQPLHPSPVVHPMLRDIVKDPWTMIHLVILRLEPLTQPKLVPYFNQGCRSDGSVWGRGPRPAGPPAWPLILELDTGSRKYPAGARWVGPCPIGMLRLFLRGFNCRTFCSEDEQTLPGRMVFSEWTSRGPGPRAQQGFEGAFCSPCDHGLCMDKTFGSAYCGKYWDAALIDSRLDSLEPSTPTQLSRKKSHTHTAS